MAKVAIGLEVSPNGVRAARVRGDKGSVTLELLAEEPLVPGIVVPGGVSDAQALTDAVKGLWSKHKLGQKSVVLGIAGPRVVVRPASIPLMPSKDVRAALPLYVAEMPSIEVAESVLDYVINGESLDDDGKRQFDGLLVATTVIEVGVDVPNASLMVIEHAERFGLSQLHQLRGRVGRGKYESSCVLIYAGPLGEIARQRLKIIFENTDGFEIARQDLQIRGPGEFVGARQSGVPLLRYADLEMDADLLEMARDVAEEMLTQHPELAEKHLQRWLGSREELLKS